MFGRLPGVPGTPAPGKSKSSVNRLIAKSRSSVDGANVGRVFSPGAGSEKFTATKQVASAYGPSRRSPSWSISS